MNLDEALNVTRARGTRMDLVVRAGIALADAVERVQQWHWKHRDGYCVACSLMDDQDVTYPCPTIRALNGEAS